MAVLAWYEAQPDVMPNSEELAHRHTIAIQYFASTLVVPRYACDANTEQALILCDVTTKVLVKCRICTYFTGTVQLFLSA